MSDPIAIRLATIVLVGAATQALAQSGGGASTVLSCALFPAHLTEAGLIEKFGRANVSDEPVVGSDDGPVSGTVVFGDNPARRVEIAWRDPEARIDPAWVSVREEATGWQSPHGVYPGATLQEVEALNGSPFRLGGFMLERGQGIVRSWGSGLLQEFEDPDCPLRVQFQPRRHDEADFSLSHELTRGSDYSSGHPAMQATNPLVVGLWISYGWR